MNGSPPMSSMWSVVVETLVPMSIEEGAIRDRIRGGRSSKP